MACKRSTPDEANERTWNEWFMKESIKSMRSEPWSLTKDLHNQTYSHVFWSNLIRRSIIKAYRKGRYEEAEAGIRLKNEEDKEWQRLSASEGTCWKA